MTLSPATFGSPRAFGKAAESAPPLAVDHLAAMTHGFPKSMRLTRRYQFRVARDANVVHTRHFVIQILPSDKLGEASESRLGVTVTKRTCPRAVARNRVKRLVREAYRLHRNLFPRADLVVIGKRGAEGLSLEEVVGEFRAVERVMARTLRRQRSKA